MLNVPRDLMGGSDINYSDANFVKEQKKHTFKEM